MPPLDIARDPVMRLIPDDPPEAFLALDTPEQARRGRLWITLYGAGFEPVYAWWFALSPEAEIAEALATVATVPDDHFPEMMKGRHTYEAGKALKQSAVEQ